MNAPGPAVGIVGAGLMGRWHAESVRRLKTRLVAVVDADIDRARALGAPFGAQAFPTVDAMLDRVRPDAAHVCTPLATHRRYSEQLLAAGCHVMCEKPLAGGADEVSRLLEVARDAGRVLCPVHQFAVQPGVQRLAERIGELGELRRIGFTFFSAGGQHLRAGALDDVVLDIVPHPLSVLARLVPGIDLAAFDWHAIRPAAGELTAIAACAGLSVSMSFSMSARPTEASATIAGTRGTAHVDFFHGFSFIARGDVSRLHKATRPFTMAAAQLGAATVNLAGRGVRHEFAYPGLRTLLAEFYRSLQREDQPPFPSAEILATYRARDALAQRIFAHP